MERPKKMDLKDKQYRLRLSDSDEKMLEYISMKTGKSKADILRTGLKMQYNLVKYTD